MEEGWRGLCVHDLWVGIAFAFAKSRLDDSDFVCC